MIKYEANVFFTCLTKIFQILNVKKCEKNLNRKHNFINYLSSIYNYALFIRICTKRMPFLIFLVFCNFQIIFFESHKKALILKFKRSQSSEPFLLLV